MKIGQRHGHTTTSKGAKALICEHTEVKQIALEVSKLLSAVGNQMVNCHPGENMSYPAELNKGIEIANTNRVELFYSVHMNKAYDSYKEAIGSEIWVYDRNSKVAIEKATRVLKNLQELGFKNRGVKYLKEHPKKRLGELERTNMEAMIIELFFIESEKDVSVYKEVGKEKIIRAIANGIDSRVSLNIQSSAPAPSKKKIHYQAHVQDKGWQDVKYNGETAGTTGQFLRMEALTISYPDIKFKGHMEDLSWTNERYSGEVIGTLGEGKRLEAIQIWGEGIKYRVHIQDIGWQEWKSSGEVAGTTGQSLRIEAIEIKVD